VRFDRNGRDIHFRKNRICDSLKSEVGAGFRVGRGGWSPGARRTRFGFTGISAAPAARQGKIAAAAKPLISLETAKENVWKSLEKVWKSLEFPWKGLDFAWKGLEKFGPVRRGLPWRVLRFDGIASDVIPAKAGIQWGKGASVGKSRFPLSRE
jgi:hypothetical protein